MNTAVIIRKKAGHDIPRGYLQEALKNCPSCYGLSIQNKDDDGEFLEAAAGARAIALDDLVKQLAQLKDAAVTLWLGNMTQDFDGVDDLMPYFFQKAVEGQEPMDILHIFMEGDFPNYSEPGKGHTDEFNLWDKFLFPQMLKEYQAAQGDDDLFFGELRKSPFEQMVMNTVGHRAAVVMIPYTGEPICFGKNELGGEFDWGETSNRFKWGDPSLLEKAAGAAVETVKKTRGRLAALMDTSSAVVVPAEPRPDPAKGNPPGVHNVADVNNKKGKTEVVDPFARWTGTSSKTHTLTPPPKGLTGNARNRWIRIFLGLDQKADLPSDKDHPNFMIPIPNSWMGFAQEDVSTNEDVKQLGYKVKSFQEAGDVSAGMKTVAQGNIDHKTLAPDVKKIEPTAAPPKKGGEVEVRPPSDFLPEIKADDKTASMNVIHDWATNGKRPTALEIQKIEMKWPLATKMFGIKWDDVCTWSIADKKLLCKKYPDVAALFMTEAILRANGAIVDEPAADVNDKEPKPAEQVEVPSPQPGTTPAQPSTKPAGRKSRLASLTSAA